MQRKLSFLLEKVEAIYYKTDPQDLQKVVSVPSELISYYPAPTNFLSNYAEGSIIQLKFLYVIVSCQCCTHTHIYCSYTTSIQGIANM